MAGSYEIWLTDDHGLRLALLDYTLPFNATRDTGVIAHCTVNVPATFDESLIQLDYGIQIWRAPPGGRMSLWRPYFLRKWRFDTTADGEEVIKLTGVDCNDLLRRRHVIAYAGTAQADKTDFADDMMKEIVTEALADGVAPVPAAGTRVWADLSVQADSSDGPTLTKAFAYDKLLYPSGGGLLSSIAKASKEAGTEVFFDVQPHTVGSNAINYEFRTFTGQIGLDVTGIGMLFSQEKGNLSQPFLEYDHTEEENYIYAGGQDTETARNIQQVYDAALYGASQWNRCEGFQDARNQTAANGVRESGRAALEEGSPRIRAGGTPLDTHSSRFQTDWDFGYKVRERYRGKEFDCIVRTVTIGMDGNRREFVQARLEYES
jgi:hypothetical protein